MYRIFATTCVLALLATAGCNSRPEGVMNLDSTGRLQMQHQIYWSQAHMDWDVRVDCELTGSYGHETLLISAYDNTYRDGLFVDIQLQEFQGDGAYTRTENQPLQALSLLLLDDETDTWTIGTADGGSCAFEVASGGREGTFDCQDVPGSVSATLSFDDVHLQGDWLCTGLYWTDSYVDDVRTE